LTLGQNFAIITLQKPEGEEKKRGFLLFLFSFYWGSGDIPMFLPRKSWELRERCEFEKAARRRFS
jgi:hypothetical protein